MILTTGLKPLAILSAVALLLLGGCDGSAESVVLYVSADEYVARQVVDAFESATGIDVQMVGDTEAKKTTGLVQRLRNEADNPQADVFWSSEVLQTIKLAGVGILETHRSETTRAWPEAWRDPDDRWFAFAARARVIAYAPDRIDPAELPRSWMDLTDPAWSGRLVMADPRFGTTGTHLAAMKAYWAGQLLPAAYFEAFLLGLRDNRVRLMPSGNAGVVRAIADGEADLGMTDTDD
ncbi:MAG: extracellular solute-binding protein, partial [Planctomycetota bacterium]